MKTPLSDHIPDDSQVITQINTSSVVHCVFQYRVQKLMKRVHENHYVKSMLLSCAYIGQGDLCCSAITVEASKSLPYWTE